MTKRLLLTYKKTKETSGAKSIDIRTGKQSRETFLRATHFCSFLNLKPQRKSQRYTYNREKTKNKTARASIYTYFGIVRKISKE